MPRQKRRFNVRFPPSRIKKIMQKDTEVGRIAMAVPVIILLSNSASSEHAGSCSRWSDPSPNLQTRALEMFLKSLLTKTCLITQSNLSTVVSVAHMKQCIESEKLFHFLKDLVEQATTTATQKDNRGMSIWPLYRSKCHEIPVKKATEAAEMVPRRSLDSLDNNSSSSESELYICL